MGGRDVVAIAVLEDDLLVVELDGVDLAAVELDDTILLVVGADATDLGDVELGAEELGGSVADVDTSIVGLSSPSNGNPAYAGKTRTAAATPTQKPATSTPAKLLRHAILNSCVTSTSTYNYTPIREGTEGSIPAPALQVQFWI